MCVLKKLIKKQYTFDFFLETVEIYVLYNIHVMLTQR